MSRNVIRSIVLIVLLFTLSHAAFGQFGIRTGLKAGYNSSSMTGDVPNDAERLHSISGGLGMELNLMVIAVQADLLYSPKGYVVDGNDIRLNYLSLPVVAKIKFFPVIIHPYILGGIEYNHLLSAKADGNDIKDDLASSDFSGVAGAGLEFSLFGKAVYAEVRYIHGLSNISKIEGTELNNRTYQMLFGMLF